MTPVLITMGLAIMLLAVLVVGLLRSHAEILRSLHELGVGEDLGHEHPESALSPRPRLNADAPSDLTGQTLRGSTVHIGVAGIEARTLLAFLSTGCTACLGLWNELADDPSAGIGGARLVVVAKGPESESQSRLQELAPSGVNVVQSSEAWESYGVPVTPYFVLVDGPTGTVVGEGSAGSWGQVRSLMRQAGADLEAKHAEIEPAAHPEMKADAELRKAGIGPGHPSLYPDRAPIDGE
jgi:hypothetical protein